MIQEVTVYLVIIIAIHVLIVHLMGALAGNFYN